MDTTDSISSRRGARKWPFDVFNHGKSEAPVRLFAFFKVLISLYRFHGALLLKKDTQEGDGLPTVF